MTSSTLFGGTVETLEEKFAAGQLAAAGRAPAEKMCTASESKPPLFAGQVQLAGLQ